VCRSQVGLRLVHLHPYLLTIILAMDAASILRDRLQPSLLLTGPPSTGKSHLMEIAAELMIPESTQEVRYQSALASLSTYNDIGYIRRRDDAPPEEVGGVEDRKSSSLWDRFKLACGRDEVAETEKQCQMKTRRTGKMIQRTETASVEDGDRTTKVGHSLRTGTEVVGTNYSVARINPAIRARTVEFMVLASDRKDYRTPFSLRMAAHQIAGERDEIARIHGAGRDYVASAKVRGGSSGSRARRLTPAPPSSLGTLVTPAPGHQSGGRRVQ
jgi:energy-coupling factor transporter ATP-binding protein EcfA2